MVYNNYYCETSVQLKYPNNVNETLQSVGGFESR